MLEEAKGQIPIVRVALNYPLAGNGGATLAFETYVPQDADKKHYDRLVDRLEGVASRQMLKGAIAAKESQLAAAIDQIASMKKDVERLDARRAEEQERESEAGRRNPRKLPAGEAQARIQVIDNIKLLEERQTTIKADILALGEALKIED